MKGAARQYTVEGDERGVACHHLAADLAILVAGRSARSN